MNNLVTDNLFSTPYYDTLFDTEIMYMWLGKNKMF